MADVHNKITRSYNMSMIRGKNTKTEILIRKFLHSKGLRFRLHDAKLPGKPDIVLPKYNSIIQVHGCFWHGHENCKYFVIPKTRTEWWLKKINKTKIRDVENLKELKKIGWKTIVLWECELIRSKKENTLNTLYENLTCQN